MIFALSIEQSSYKSNPPRVQGLNTRLVCTGTMTTSLPIGHNDVAVAVNFEGMNLYFQFISRKSHFIFTVSIPMKTFLADFAESCWLRVS